MACGFLDRGRSVPEGSLPVYCLLETTYIHTPLECQSHPFFRMPSGRDPTHPDPGGLGTSPCDLVSRTPSPCPVVRVRDSLSRVRASKRSTCLSVLLFIIRSPRSPRRWASRDPPSVPPPPALPPVDHDGEKEAEEGRDCHSPERFPNPLRFFLPGPHGHSGSKNHRGSRKLVNVLPVFGSPVSWTLLVSF